MANISFRKSLLTSIYTLFAIFFYQNIGAQCPDLMTESLTSPDCVAGTTPCDVCAGDVISLNATGENLQDGGMLDWYYSTSPVFDPYVGQGTLMGSSLITSTGPGPCTTCPLFLGHIIDACANPEADNEYMLVWSGSGFAVDDFQVDFSPNNNITPPLNDDINTGMGCDWTTPPVGSVNCAGAIMAGPGTDIPANALVVIFTSSGLTASYDFSVACLLGIPVYVMMNGCDRGVGAFSNGSSSGFRTTEILIDGCACSDAITYDTDHPTIDPTSPGTFVTKIPIINTLFYGTSAGCGVPSNLPTPPPTTGNASLISQFDYTIPQSMCNGGPYYVVGILNPGPPIPCPNESTGVQSFNVICPTATPASIDVCNTNTGAVFADLTQVNGIVNGGTGQTVQWWQDPSATFSVNFPGNALVPPTNTFYATVGSGVCQSSPVPVTINILQGPDANDISFSVNPPNACGETTVTVTFNFPTNDGYDVEMQYGNLINGFIPWSNVVFNNVPYQFTISETTEFQLLSAEDANCPTDFLPPITETVTIEMPPFAIPISITECGDGMGFAIFNLTESNNIINAGTTEEVNWYLNNGATIPINDPTSFLSNNNIVYAVVGTQPCVSDPVAIDLIVEPAPMATDADLEECDTGNGSAIFDLTSLENTINGGSGQSVMFYVDVDLTIPINNPDSYQSGNGIVYAVVSGANCDSQAALITLTLTNANMPQLGTASICENDGLYDLTQLEDPNFLSGTWSGDFVTGTNFDPSGLIDDDYTVTFTPDGDCEEAATTTITVSAGMIPNLLTGEVCENGIFDLLQLVDPNFPTGMWDGDGVEGNEFDPFNLSGTINLTFTPDANCTQIGTTTITILEGTTGTLTGNYCSNQTVDVNGTIFDINMPSSSVIIGSGAENGCDSTVMVDLIFDGEITFDLNETLCPGDSLVIENEVFNEAMPTGSVTILMGSQQGCDSTINVNLSFYAPIETNLTPTLCTGGSLQVGTEIFDEITPMGTVVFEGEGENGCDSTVFVSLTFNSEVTFDLNETLCPGDSLVIENEVFNETMPTGSVTIPMGSELGCDSTINVNLSFYDPIETNLTPTLCTGGSLQVGTEIFDEITPMGTVVFEGEGENGCDSTVFVSLTFNSEVTFDLNETLCPGDSLVIENEVFNETMPTGSVTIPMGSQQGCDSVINVNLSFYTPIETNINEVLCTGGSLQVGTEIFDEVTPTGTVVFEGEGENGCDSTVFVNLTFNSEVVFNVTQTLCPGDSLIIENEVFNEAMPTGSVTISMGSQQGCDSVINVNLSFYAPIETNITETLCTGGSLQVGTEIFDEITPTGTVVFEGEGENGCDSTVFVNLTFNSEVTFDLNETLCPGDSLVIENEVFNETMPTGSVTIPMGSQQGCDSVINVNLSFYTPIETNLTPTLCTGGSLQVGTEIFDEITPTGTVVFEGEGENGCDSTVFVNLTFNSEITFDINETLCPGDSLVIENEVFNEAMPTGSVTIPMGSQMGCDSTINVNLSFHAPVETNFDMELCAGGSIEVGGQTFDEMMPTGTVVFENMTANGCDSTVFVNLTFATEVFGDYIDTLCMGDFVEINGEIFDETTPTGSTTIPMGSQMGCDSTINVSLSFYPIAEGDFFGTLCEGESIEIGGEIFDENNTSGTVILPDASVNGCDSTLNVSIIFYDPVSSVFEETFCGGGFLVIGGETFDEDNPSGTVLLENANYNGCDSTIIVNLTFNGESIVSANPQLCEDESIAINGTIYSIDNQTGTEVIASGNYLGCDSIINVTVEILANGMNEINLSLDPDENIVIDGVIFDINNPSGTIILDNANYNGCDSVIIIDLIYLSIQTSLTSPACFGDSDGGISITQISGGAPPYAVSINGNFEGEFSTFPIEITDLNSGIYDITIQESGGAEFTQQINVPAAEFLDVDITSVTDLFAGESAPFSVSSNFDIVTYNWSPTGSVSCVDCADAMAIPTETTTFTLEAFDANGCSATDDFTINVAKLGDQEIAFAPNIFSPNGDGFNEFFFIHTIKGITNLKDMKIFNRWGNLVFSTNDIAPNIPENGWNGLYNGELVDVGVYVFMVEIDLPDGTTKIFKGDFMVMR